MEDILTQVKNAHALWGAGIVQIGRAEVCGDSAERYANEMLNALYNFKDEDPCFKGDILFKPTLAVEHPIRLNRKQTLSYFIGGQKEEDKGFALKPWKRVEFHDIDERNIISHGDITLVMGIYTFYNYKEVGTTVEYSFGYVKGEPSDYHPKGAKKLLEQNHLRIVLHHSSLPPDA